jgi:hypothetical protein
MPPKNHSKPQIRQKTNSQGTLRELAKNLGLQLLVRSASRGAATIKTSPTVSEIKHQKNIRWEARAA